MKALDMITCRNSSSSSFFFGWGRGESLSHILDQCSEPERSEKKKNQRVILNFKSILCSFSAGLFYQNLYFKLYPLTSVFNRQANF